MKIIGLIGRKRSGKSTAAQHFLNVYKGQKLSFGDPIKDMLRALGLTEDQLYGDEKEIPTDKLSGQTPRYALQRLGDEWGRFLMHEDFWIHRIREFVQPGRVYVFDDIRRQNEADFIKSKGGTTIKIVRPSLLNNDTHGSEADVDAIKGDYLIENVGSIKDFIAKLEMVNI